MEDLMNHHQHAGPKASQPSDALPSTEESKDDATGEKQNAPASVCETDCNAEMLETMDSCVTCVEGVELQHDFEESLQTMELIESPLITAGTHQELSQTEATMIRLQIMEKENAEFQRRASPAAEALSTFNEIDLLNLCGSEDDMETRNMTATNVSETDSSFTSGVGNESSSPRGASPVNMASGSLATGPNADEPLQCAICFDKATASSKRVTFAKLPCCGYTDETSALKICTSCVLVLTNPTSNGSCRVGRCPRCRSWILVRTPTSTQHSELQISQVTASGNCVVCNQMKDHLVEEEGSVCDACFLGRRYALLYECENCHVTQRIPHPMYRYQSSPDQFGSVAWTCHGQCGAFSHWKIRSDQVELIPVGDAPQEWGDDYLAAARARVVLARSQLVEADGNGCPIL